MISLEKPSATGKAKRKLADISKDTAHSDSLPAPSSSSSLASDSTSDSGSEASHVRETEPVPDEPVLSHAEKRRQKKRKLNSADAVPADVSSESRTKSVSTPLKPKKGKKPEGVSEASDAPPKRQNSVWIGNLAYKTTAVMLKNFFEGLEVTRIHMPMKTPPSGAGPMVNSGFAYVDFATPDAKVTAITLSERNLEGRRLLIKDGEDFAGRPTTITTNTEGIATTTTEPSTLRSAAPKTGLTKIAHKILAAQKQPPGPTLFFGNLGFEATEDSIRQLLEAHRKKPTETPSHNDDEESSDNGREDGGEAKVKPKGNGPRKEDKWLRKIRMGTFEDSGKCKGWAFADFTSTEHATSALINPRNHSLDGRKLTVEYASPDAVRRGGGPRGESGDYKHKTFKGRDGPGKVRKPRSDGHIEREPKPAAGQLTEGGERELERVERKLKRGSGFERASSRRGERPKPGAALALAQRGTAAILPSQGQKITF
ncbi:hypothetical protein BJ322DRAFT_1072274 [Thelephora terrestris]|uniref:RRM domain-containing protein n=1 Tax=Thelephora terrestris TaxID=56493 RepID=A0A9P6HAR5_9AGAM|nr:hypothetical protein BJ322DRAFT_1072274 [Thelephora terrestris]